MPEHGVSRSPLDDPHSGTLAAANIIVFLTKPARCEASASIELSTGMEFVDQISQPEMFAPRPRDTALSFSSETIIPMPNSLWPVTILLTSNVIVASYELRSF